MYYYMNFEKKFSMSAFLDFDNVELNVNKNEANHEIEYDECLSCQ